MQIIITPNDIIQRCLWDKYKKHVLHDKKEDEIEKIVDENKPVSLSENDAYVIGLLKVIETDNLVHRFNENILELLQIKSNIIKDELYINKNVLLRDISNYMNKFPEYYKAPFNYKESIEDLQKYINELEDNLTSIDIINVKNNDKIFVYFKSKDVKKQLKI